MKTLINTIGNILHNDIKHLSIYTARKISSVRFKNTDRYWSTRIKIFRLKHAELISRIVSGSIYITLALIVLLIIRRILA